MVGFTLYLRCLLQDMVIYPVSGGKFINVLAVKYTPDAGTVYDGPWSEPTTAEIVAKVFEGWEPRAVGLIKVSLFLGTCSPSQRSH